MLLCFLLALLVSQSLFAQTAALRGQVTDESGAVVPGASITLTGADASVKTAATDRTGSYSFTGLAPGDYKVEASAPELVQPQPASVSVRSGVQTLNLRLRVASTVQRVTVQDNPGPAVSTTAAENASALVLRGDDLQALSDDPDDLQADLQALAGPAAGPGGGSIFIDGFSGGEIPAKQSIREIRINQNPFSPEYDKLGYGRIEILTKPGSDRYHGTADYNLGTEVWNTRNPYAARKAPFLLNEFEGNAGGPLGKRSSFTLDAQRNMVDNGSIMNAVTLDPQTLGVTPFTGAVTSPQRFIRLTPRIDHQLTANNTLTFRYGITHATIQDAGIGGFDLASRGYRNQFTNQLAQVTETAVVGTAINELRFQYYRSAIQMIANSQIPEIQVLGSFNGGGSQYGRSFDTQNSFELQNYTTMVRGTHTWKFGVRLRGQTEDSVSPQNFNGTFTFAGGGLAPILNGNNLIVQDASGQPMLGPISSIERYRRTLVFQQLGDSPAQVRALGGGATQFTINAGLPELSIHQIDVGAFAGDEWRVRPNMTVSLGLRYETQTNIHDFRDFAPRAAVAWAPGRRAKNNRSKTVLRAGFGMFYTRFPLTSTLTAERYNGVVQHQYVVANPDFYPSIPDSSSLAGFESSQAIQQVSAQMRAPYIMQSAFTVERQLPANTTLAVSYTNSRGVHMFRSEDINAPLPGTYDPRSPSSGVFPRGRPGALFLMESSGVYNQNQIIANVNSRLNQGVSLFGFYVFNKAMSNTDGFGTFPANPYNFAGEYGPAATDVRHRVSVGGSVNTKWNIRWSPFLVIQSGAPFDITTGSDLYGTTLFNARPAIATDLAKPGLIQTSYGVLDPNPSPGQHLLSRNYGRGPAQISVNMRLAKTIGLGPERGEAGETIRQGPGGGNAAAIGGAIPRPVFGTTRTSHRYNLTISMSARNLLNHTNAGPISGNITSPLFGLANQIAGTPNGEGFYETANNRRLEMQVRFAF